MQAIRLVPGALLKIISEMNVTLASALLSGSKEKMA